MQLHPETNEEGENSTRQMSDSENASDQIYMMRRMSGLRDDCDQTG